MNGNQHCGKHDKIFTEENPCPGCETEKAQAKNPKHGEEGHEHKEEEEAPRRKTRPPPKKEKAEEELPLFRKAPKEKRKKPR